MKLLFLTLLFIALSEAQYNVEILNTFSADVDIYNMGRMGRGKNACSWHRSVADKQEVFYYLAMQPWRHLVWTIYEKNEWVKYYINEDASSIPAKTKTPKVDNSEGNDYCRKEYATPMDTYDIDWNQIDPESRLESVDINGMTCFKYPAKIPLNHIYLKEHYTRSQAATVMTPCRYDFIGGKQITFRSFNSFSAIFITDDAVQGYKLNMTRCIIDPTPNNVQTDLAIVLGIADTNVVQNINNALKVLDGIANVNQKMIYYSSGESVKVEELKDWDTLKLKKVSSGSVDAIITMAKENLVKRINAKKIQRGTLIVLMDRPLSTSFDAETAFDRNGITVHTVVYNPKDDSQIVAKARTLLSVGAQHHEFTSPNGYSAVAQELFVGVRANLTERCDRTKCDGFCDARDRCTCPMCCENTCFFSYCDTTTATCKPWPPAKPKAKITCDEDCVGERECRDLEGCVYIKYNEGCKPTAKCMKAQCKESNKTQCEVVNGCETDKTPSYNNRCWSYKCNEQTGNCMRDQSGDECPRLPSLCHEYVCDEKTLKCTTKQRTCVKTSPYIEMPCYVARCNRKNGKCENVLSCDSYTGCGVTADKTRCRCDPKNGEFKCTCEDATTEGYCSNTEVCDSTVEGQDPHCVKSDCGEDLYIDGCKIKRCNKTSKLTYWEEKDCSEKVKFTFFTKVKDLTKEDAENYCKDKYAPYCYEGECFGEMTAEDDKAGCGKCIFNEAYTVKDGVKTYTVEYVENCGSYYPRCADGSKPSDYSMFEKKEGATAECKNVAPTGEAAEYKCVYPSLTEEQGYDFCKQCYSTLECYLDKNYRKYTYNQDKGTCSYETIGTKEECSTCLPNQSGFKSYCEKGLKIEKDYTYTNGGKSKTFKYNIPKECAYGQCIPDPDFDCMIRTGDSGVPAIVEQLLQCSQPGTVTGVYHYSTNFDKQKYYSGEQQSDKFMAEAEAQAYCEWTTKEKDCLYCGFEEGNDNMVKVDRCLKEHEELDLPDLITLSCVPEENKCKVDEFACEPKDCYYYIPDPTKGCVKTDVTSCTLSDKSIKDAKASWKKSAENEKEIICPVDFKCNPTTNECPIISTNVDSECEAAYKEYTKDIDPTDFGCRIPNVKCDETTYHCTFTPMTHPENDTAWFLNRDGVKFGHKCYNYTCVESFNDKNQLEHHWVLSEESRIELAITADHLCETVTCDPELGYTIHKPKVCTPIEAFKMTEEQAQCFACQCSYIDGEPQIVMLSSTNEETYELDACGNCIVRDRLTGEQKNKHVECILSATVNLTGAIAGATVAASVVFGLIGAMVVVSIGAFQTYQLVSSAMKNVISTTLENPEFVAADNEATNVLAGGD